MDLVNENYCKSIEISLRLIPLGPVDIGAVNHMAPVPYQAITPTNAQSTYVYLCHQD